MYFFYWEGTYTPLTSNNPGILLEALCQDPKNSNRLTTAMSLQSGPYSRSAVSLQEEVRSYHLSCTSHARIFKTVLAAFLSPSSVLSGGRETADKTQHMVPPWDVFERNPKDRLAM